MQHPHPLRVATAGFFRVQWKRRSPFCQQHPPHASSFATTASELEAHEEPGDLRGGRPILHMVKRPTPGRGGDARVSRFVPWIFHRDVANAAELRATGKVAEVVTVMNADGRELGVAACNLRRGGRTNVNIMARMLVYNAQVSIDKHFFIAQIQRALQLRNQFLGEASCLYRLMNGEGDQVPGVICDRFDNVFCLSFTSGAMEVLFEQDICRALVELFNPKAVVVRYDATPDRLLEQSVIAPPSVKHGELREPLVVTEQDTKFNYQLDLLADHCAPGRYFEDRPVRALALTALASFAKPSGGEEEVKVLSFFGDSVGLACAARGARVAFAWAPSCHVGGEYARNMAAANGFGDRVSLIRLDKPQAQLLPEGSSAAYHIVTLEPPPLAPYYGMVEEGMRQYTAWVCLAASAVRPQGILLVVCRSRTISTVLFLRFINMGLWAARRKAEMYHHQTAPPFDFPTHAAIPDSKEFQFVALRLH